MKKKELPLSVVGEDPDVEAQLAGVEATMVEAARVVVATV